MKGKIYFVIFSSILMFGCGRVSTSTPVPSATGPSITAAETNKIEKLLERVSSCQVCTFIRNGAGFTPPQAVDFLRAKWKSEESNVHSLQDFIEKVASYSSTTGQPYLVKTSDGKFVNAKDWYLEQLKNL